MPIATIFQFLLPRWLAIRLAVVLGNICFILMKQRRERIYDNLGYILGSTAVKNIRHYARKLFVNYAICMTDLLRAPLLTKEKLLAMIRFNDYNNFNQALAKGKGAILCTAHIGNWDLAGVFLSRIGYPLVAAVEPIGQGMTEAFNRYRGTTGMKLVSLNDTHNLVKSLTEKKVLVLLADRDLTGHGIELPVFDAKRSFPKGPAIFALRYNIPILFGYFVLNSKQNKPYFCGIEPEINFPKTDKFKQDVYTLTEIIAKRINRLIQEYPDQWFVFQADWQLKGN
ncbi:MAG: lysophospholipid acyltransferase family protein [candidate division WOR-3 bacterium]|nr:lysophospholipid acyltransferase family protein [candidate division WOR-3 bacterium]MDH5683568.1 lysophospholipid acyltransferase family protein [candidate division WOR-3 bacterium]